jgi:hypothetical protein
MDQIVGEGRHVYVASSEGLVTVDVSVPASPRVTSTVPTTDARQVYFTENVLYLADGAGGLRIFGIDDPAAPVALAEVNVSDARAVRVSGGYAYVAGGSTGLLAVIDVLDPARPRVETLVDLGPGAVARDVFIFSHYANPPLERRPKDFSILAYVACGTGGVKVVDIGDPAAPLVLATFPTTDARALLVASVYIGGGSTERSLEREFLLVADGAGGLRILDVSEPGSATLVAAYPAGGSVTAVSAVHAFEPPVNRLYAYLAVEGGGLVVLDLSKPDSPLLVPSSQAPLLSVAGIAPERIRLDRLVDETGRKVKDSSHEGARPFTREEMDRILRAPIVR